MGVFTGINHLAMVTADMDATIRFWRDLLELRMVAGLGRPGYRHYFFEISSQDMIAFFEWSQVEAIPEKDHGVPVRGPVAFDHISLGVESRESLWALKDRLEANGFWVSEVVDHGFIWSIYSFDPNNIPIEFSWSVPTCNIRTHPIMVDPNPSAVAREGAEPCSGAWARSDGPSVARTVYPGEAEVILAAIKTQSKRRS